MSETPSFRIVNARRLNAKTWANNFRARVLLPGLVSYEDQGCGLALLSHESIANSIQTFVGRPLILTPKLNHKHVEPETMERDASGYITKAYFDNTDGWFYVEGTVFADKAKDAISKVGLVSCAYKVTKTGNGGERNAIKYQEEILQFSGEHLAIVDNPRYEGATIRLNSKQSALTNTNPMNLFKFWSKQPASSEGAPAVVEVVKENAIATVPTAAATATDISADSEIELAGGVKVTLAELIAHRENAKADGMDGDKAFDVSGKAVKLSDLVAAYNKLNDVKEEKEKGEDEDDKAKKENAAPAAVVPEVAPVAAKKDFFKILTNASVENSIVQDGVKLSAGSINERLDNGKARYGSAAPATK